MSEADALRDWNDCGRLDSAAMQAAKQHYIKAWKRVLWDATGDQTKVDRTIQLAEIAGLFNTSPEVKYGCRLGDGLCSCAEWERRTCHNSCIAIRPTRALPQAPKPDPRGGPFFLTQWEREDYERRQRGEPELGPGGSALTQADGSSAKPVSAEVPHDAAHRQKPLA